MADLLADSFGLLTSKNLVLPHESVDDAVRRHVLSVCAKSLTETRDYRKWLIEATKRWEAMRSTRSLDSDDPGTPWHWASNVGIPLELMTGESLVPRFNAATSDADPIFRVTVTSDRSDDKLAEQPLTTWYQEFFTRTIRLRRVRHETYLNLILDGDGIEGVEWVEEWRQTSRKQLLLKNAKDEVLVDEQGNPKVFPHTLNDEGLPRDPMTGEKLTRFYVQQKGDQLLYRGAKIRSWRLQECLWPWYATTGEINELDWFAVQMWKSTSWFSTREGDPIDGKLKNVPMLIDRYRNGIPDTAISKTETDLTAGVDFPKIPDKILVWLWFGKFDVDSDGKDEEIMALVSPKERVVLGWRLSPFAKRPFFHYQLYQMPGRFIGRGLPHVLKGLRDVTDFFANSANNRANLYLDPPLLYEGGSGYDPDTMEFGTGAKWGPLNDGAIAGRKVSALELPQQQELMAERFMNLYMSLGQRLTGVTDFNLGGPSRTAAPNVRTARGTQAVLGESNIRYADWIRSFQDTSEEEAEFVDGMIKDLTSDEETVRLMSVAPMTLAYLRLPKQFHATGNSQTMNRQLMQQQWVQLFELMVNDPIFQLLPETQLELRKRLIDLFDIDLPLPKKEQVAQLQLQKLTEALSKLPPEQLAQIAQHIMQGRPGAPADGRSTSTNASGTTTTNGNSPPIQRP